MSFDNKDPQFVYYAIGRKEESDSALAKLIAKDQIFAAIQIAEVYAFQRSPTRLLSGWTGLMCSTTQESQRPSGTLG
jgi:hypothetical protein